MGRGSRNIISMSKMRNKIASRKNRMEKGIRAFEEGSNPHSKAESFSRSLILWILIILNKKNKILGRMITVNVGGIIVIMGNKVLCYCYVMIILYRWVVYLFML